MDKKKILLKGDEPLEEWLKRSIRDYLPEKPAYTEEDLITVAETFFGDFTINGEIYTGFDGLIIHKHGMLIDKALEIGSKHKKIGKELLSIPEYAAIVKEIDEFEKFIIKYFGYDPRAQKFINESETTS